MSLKVQLLECDTCRTAVFAFPLLPSVYWFAPGDVLRMRSAFGWCEDCQKVRQAEALPGLVELDAEEASWRKLAQTQPGGLDRYEQRELDSIGLYRRLLSVRQHRNRCLECGSEALQSWRMDAEGNMVHNPHGGCTGRFRFIDDPDEMRIALVDDDEAYTSEGDYLGRLSEQHGFDREARF